jgi:hypothetical protein
MIAKIFARTGSASGGEYFSLSLPTALLTMLSRREHKRRWHAGHRAAARLEATLVRLTIRPVVAPDNPVVKLTRTGLAGLRRRLPGEPNRNHNARMGVAGRASGLTRRVSVVVRAVTLVCIVTRFSVGLSDHDRTRGRDIGSGAKRLYGCDEYKECESEPWPSPPYDPKQPKRCVTHREPMQTEIKDDDWLREHA